MKRKLVTDSAANLLTLPGADFAAPPMRIQSAAQTYVDDEALDVKAMLDELGATKGRTRTSCPSPQAWLEAFDDAEEVYCVTITSALSGSYNAAQAAARQYLEAHPERRVLLIDSLSAGPEMTLLVEELRSLISGSLTFEQIEAAIRDYHARTSLMFCLQSLRMLAQNGRVNPALAALMGMLSIRMVGRASDQGTLEPFAKCRGDQKALTAMVEEAKQRGYTGDKMVIAHCENEKMANDLRGQLLALFPNAPIRVTTCRGLCAYYAERGGLMVGFETAAK